ncbi:MAG: 4-phosphopantetheinyl transferase family protein, partial [Gemmatimonadetes bacterium]|nr:4-phosphopantetheinyl transferase family protein [Gemmatimonadota bacterium]
ERAVVTGDPPADRARRFFTTWSRKEAYIKATGDGIVPGLDHFDVSSAADDARLLADRRTPGATERWAMCALDLGPDVAGAVVWDRLVSPPIRIVRCLVATPATLGLPGT